MRKSIFSLTISILALLLLNACAATHTSNLGFAENAVQVNRKAIQSELSKDVYVRQLELARQLDGGDPVVAVPLSQTFLIELGQTATALKILKLGIEGGSIEACIESALICLAGTGIYVDKPGAVRLLATAVYLPLTERNYRSARQAGEFFTSLAIFGFDEPLWGEVYRSLEMQFATAPDSDRDLLYAQLAVLNPTEYPPQQVTSYYGTVLGDFEGLLKEQESYLRRLNSSIRQKQSYYGDMMALKHEREQFETEMRQKWASIAVSGAATISGAIAEGSSVLNAAREASDRANQLSTSPKGALPQQIQITTTQSRFSGPILAPEAYGRAAVSFRATALAESDSRRRNALERAAENAESLARK